MGATRGQVLGVDSDNRAVLEGYKHPSLRIGVLYRRWSSVVALRSPLKDRQIGKPNVKESTTSGRAHKISFRRKENQEKGVH